MKAATQASRSLREEQVMMKVIERQTSAASLNLKKENYARASSLTHTSGILSPK
jgi:hypothetical protein